MATYNVHGGHNSLAPGAGKYLNELNEDRAVKNRVIALLRAAGHTVYDCTDDVGRTASQNLANIVAKCNSHRVDLDISIHLNAGGGTGTEVWYYSGSSVGASKASTVSAAVASALGLRNRGAKASTGLYVLKNTISPAILIECCFVDNMTDKNAWNVEKCAKAIVEAVTGASAPNIPAGSGVSSGSSTSSGGKVSVDGWWGKKTTLALQHIFKTGYYDGIVSNQDPAQKPYLLRADSGSWDFAGRGNGSDLIGAMQRIVGVKDDGFMGPKTIRAWQSKLGVTIDGYMGVNTVMALQNWINRQ